MIRWSLNKWALFAEVVGGVGIIVSILYLALEVEQYTESVQAADHLALIEHLGVVRSWNVRNGEFADIVVPGNEDFESLNAGKVRVSSTSRISISMSGSSAFPWASVG